MKDNRQRAYHLKDDKLSVFNWAWSGYAWNALLWHYEHLRDRFMKLNFFLIEFG